MPIATGSKTLSIANSLAKYGGVVLSVHGVGTYTVESGPVDTEALTDVEAAMVLKSAASAGWQIPEGQAPAYSVADLLNRDVYSRFWSEEQGTQITDEQARAQVHAAVPTAQAYLDSVEL
jgi:hypothetical protein